jgi:hypothetical protein
MSARDDLIRDLARAWDDWPIIGPGFTELVTAATQRVDALVAETRRNALREAADAIDAMVTRWAGMGDRASDVMDTRHAMAERVRRMAEGGDDR